MQSASPITEIVRGNVALRTDGAPALMREIRARVWAVREPMGVAEWTGKFRILPPKVSDTPGLVDLDKTPYLRGFLDAAGDPAVKRITVMKASQLGFTMGLDSILLWAVDQRPTPALWICPNAELAKEAAKFRIEPGVRACPATCDRLGESKDDATTKVMDFDLMRVSFVGSGNANNLRSRPAGLVIIDDFERCEDYTLKEAEQRVAAFEESKIIIVSPPSFEGVGTHKEYALSNQMYFAVPCPHAECGHMHELVMENLRWEGGVEADPEFVERTAWMECPACKGRIENHHKPAMLRRGEWVAENPQIRTHVGFREGSFYSPWQTFGWVARGYVEAKGKPDRTWRNGVLGLPEKAPTALDIKDLEELARGAKLVPGLERWTRRTVPNDCITLIATVDIQGDYIYVLVTGFSEYGLRAYYIDHFVRPMPSNSPLEPVYHAVKERRYQRLTTGEQGELEGGWQKVVLQAWDTGHRATDTHAVWSRWHVDRDHVFMLVKGMPSVNMVKPYFYARPEDMGEGTKARAAGVKLLQMNTHMWKHRVAHALKSALATIRQLGKPRDEAEEIKEGEEKAEALEAMRMASLAVATGVAQAKVDVILGKTIAAGEGVMTAYFLPPDAPKDFLQHLASEHIKEGRWTLTTEHARNEGWDTSYYAAAAGDAAGLRDVTRRGLKKMLVTRPTEEQMRAWGLRELPESGARSVDGKPNAQRETGNGIHKNVDAGEPDETGLHKWTDRNRSVGNREPRQLSVGRKPTLDEMRARLSARLAGGMRARAKR